MSRCKINNHLLTDPNRKCWSYFNHSKYKMNLFIISFTIILWFLPCIIAISSKRSNKYSKKISQNCVSSASLNFELLSEVCSQYNNALQKYPISTKMITSGIIGMLGDSLIQNIGILKSPKEKFDFRRLFVFNIVTCFYIAPVTHYWFEFLNSIPFPADVPNIVKAAIMMIIDQSFGAIPITAGFFFAFELVFLLITN